MRTTTSNLALAVLCCAVVSCSSTSGAGSSTESAAPTISESVASNVDPPASEVARPSEYEPSWTPVTHAPTPLELAFEDRIGFTLNEVSGAYALQAHDLASSCLRDRGFVVTEALYPGPGFDAFGALPPTGSRMAAAIMALMSSPTDLAGQTPTFVAAASECEATARATAVDPLRTVSDFANQLVTDQNFRTLADPRYQTAIEQFENCLAESGYSAETLTAAGQAVLDQYYVAVDQMQRGEITQEQLLAQAELLRQEEIEQLGGPDQCNADRQRAETEVANDISSALLEQNGTSLDEALRSAATNIESVRQYLRSP